MAKRSHADWTNLIQQQPGSGLTITDYCRQHKLSTSTFYARKTNITTTPQKKGTPFVKAVVPATTPVITQAVTSQQTICLQHQTGLWTFPSSLPPSYLLEFIKGLQAC
ncbi:IS66 family insertion sequence element accessory protein TnpB [Shewanella abyssi]|uniref:IS66 family insertion sequence element accessory protein TnpA n=1 Tax=Shewanella abyssi TaxID=311789 RepID=UPI00200C18D0|nr:IS66 family insertion sequence element accessory protein TnpB [Shewanella abyssi]MCL1049479.1 IS66 family insertion sequence element accessory protein TnpB [Shewanella abyssi]